MPRFWMPAEMNYAVQITSKYFLGGFSPESFSFSILIAN